MSKTWYPVINYENCIECGACVAKCSHGVYEQGTMRPVTIFTDGCVEGCTGCQKLCPADAIDYVGAGTKATGCDCNCSC